MYQKYAAFMGWKWEELSMSKSDVGGFKEAQISISGENVFKHMKFESGVHRVQRIPENDTRIQTSAVSIVSFSGILCTLCTPDSNFICLNTFSPDIDI